jgi:Ca-activated chloride channel homolog
MPCVAFVLDRSGSMAGWKIVAARRALARTVDMLRPEDRFTVPAFNDVVEAPPGGGTSPVPATERHRVRAVDFLCGLQARAAP